MAIQEVPVRSDLPSYEFQIELEGTTYTLRFTYNGRISRWFMDISTADGTPVRVGIKVLTSWRFTKQYVDTSLPPGDFFCLDTGNEDEDPMLDDFGIRKLLTYIPSTEETG